MKKTIISHLITTILLSLVVLKPAFSQIHNSNVSSSALQWTFKEKMKLSLDQILKVAILTEEQKTILLNSKSLQAEGETNITNSSQIEAEIHAVINTVDTNNIVLSPIRQDFNNSIILCPVYYTKDFGNTWQQSSFINMPYEAGKISGGGGDPVLAFDADGRLYFTWIDLYGDAMSFLAGTVNMGIFWAYSDDGGETWVKPVHDTVLLGQLQMVFGMPTGILSPISDKQWMAVDRTSSPYHNNLYISYVSISQSGETNTYQIKCKTKPAGIDQFTTEATITTPAQFSFVQFASIAVDNLGYVHVIFYGTDNGGTSYAIWHSASTDGGQFFSSPNKVSDVEFDLYLINQQSYHEISGINPQRTYPSPYIGSDMTSGNIYATWTAFGIASDAGTGADIYFSRSTDHGTTWLAPYKVNNDAGISHNYYSTIFVKDNGVINVSWYDRRDDAGNINTHYYYAASTDGGASFGDNHQVTSIATDFSTVGSQNQNFGIGEYTQVLATPGYTIPVWCDGRQNNGVLNVYIGFINDVSVGIENLRTVTADFSSGNIFPNPAKNQASIEITLNKSSEISVSLVDVTGKKIKQLIQSRYPAGKYSITLNLSDIADGKYYCIISTESGICLKPLNIIR
ncbi:MAG: T9SS type A sorting domain-containing protein [Bacteroidia bacterium]|nr:T9SS type A sorting domain-containing protein [Bacteroidia bacterium]